MYKEGFERLGITRVYHRPVAVGSGWVRAAHGVIPVPAPVTALLLEGLEVGPNGPVTGEATTPTGAALLRVLSGGTPPGPKFLKKYAIRLGATFTCQAHIITKGTCSPVVFTLHGIDVFDHSEIKAGAK